ncbi:MAG: AAA family ATPase [Deltaproteobacteria bacterium]|uniref:AAA family ATPase n=1 Tax=Candidatus Zymogenus saltonus TaxID=2844893 RepID=A0A9D8PP52_9DELT|nr:AAA family ATPase [Candidatus Zymogenus saltonus]
MPRFLHKIRIEDFRSFKDETIELGDVTCIVGPNEGGKTNLLDAINLIVPGDLSKKEDKRNLTEDDTRKNSERFDKSKLPKITYFVEKSFIKEKIILEREEDDNKREL